MYDLHAAIWAMLEDDTCATDLVEAGLHFTDLVAATKRRKMTATSWDFFREHAGPGDYPETTVVQTAHFATEKAACNLTYLDVLIQVWIATGQQPGERLRDVQWAVFRQMQNWKAHLGQESSLTWNSKRYCWNFDLVKSDDSLTNEVLNRKVKGWTSVWNGIAFLNFTPSDLIA